MFSNLESLLQHCFEPRPCLIPCHNPTCFSTKSETIIPLPFKKVSIHCGFQFRIWTCILQIGLGLPKMWPSRIQHHGQSTKLKKKKKSLQKTTQGTTGYGLTFFYLMPASLNAKCDPGYLIVTGCVKLELQCLNRWWSCLASFPSVFWYMQLFLLFTC